MLRIYLTPRCSSASFVTMTMRSKTLSFVRPNLNQGIYSNSIRCRKEVALSSIQHSQGKFSTSSSTLLYGGSKYNVGSGSQEDNSKKINDEQNDDKAAADIEPTWTYTPYKPPPPKGNRNKRGPGNGQQRRNFSSRKDDDWVVPNKVTIPADKIDMSFARSSGAGGQNVNKVNIHCILSFLFHKKVYAKSNIMCFDDRSIHKL